VTGFVRAKKSNGEFRTPFNPVHSNFGSDYTEGSAWQYSWYMPHDNAGLISFLGGDTKLVEKIDQVFDAKVDETVYAHMEDISGLIGHYAHGNEPSHHVAYLYNYAGAPWRTQERLANIMATQYSDKPDGLSGNDDLGQMSAWFAFTALGFYPVAPASNEYVIGRPFLDKATLNLPNGKRFTVRADNLSAGNGYVGRVEAAAVRLSLALPAPDATVRTQPVPITAEVPPPHWDVFARARGAPVAAFNASPLRSSLS